MRVALLADLHFGVKKSDGTFQTSQLRFFENQLVSELKEENIDTIIICGDVFDTRQSVNVQTENVVINLFKNTLADFKIHIIVGNHDMYHTTSTDVNSLKVLDLLPNVTVYEQPTEVIFDKQKVLMLPWVTNYEDFETTVLNNYEYAFAHLDIIGFDMGNRMLSTAGLSISQTIAKIKHTYTGHYHCRSHKEYQDGQTITYIGSPYQVTRIDRGQERGYAILNFDDGKFEWKNNTQSMIFTEHVYPKINEALVPNNVVDIKIPVAHQNETKLIYDLVQRLNKLGPAYPVNTINEDAAQTDSEIQLDLDAFNLTQLFKTYIEQLETKLDKNELYGELVKLYDMMKGVNT